MSKKIIFDVDTQVDFLSPEGSSFVGDENLIFDWHDHPKESASIVANIEHALIEALRNEVVIIGSVFAYPESYGMSECVIGTDGQEKINATMLVEPEFYYNVASTKHGIDLNVSSQCWQIVFEKMISDIWDPLLGQPDNIHSFLRTEDVDTVYIVGNDHEDSIADTIDGLVQSRYNVKVVFDAITNWDFHKHHHILNEMGVECISTDELVEELKRGNNGTDSDS